MFLVFAFQATLIRREFAISSTVSQNFSYVMERPPAQEFTFKDSISSKSSNTSFSLFRTYQQLIYRLRIEIDVTTDNNPYGFTGLFLTAPIQLKLQDSVLNVTSTQPQYSASFLTQQKIDIFTKNTLFVFISPDSTLEDYNGFALNVKGVLSGCQINYKLKTKFDAFGIAQNASLNISNSIFIGFLSGTKNVSGIADRLSENVLFQKNDFRMDVTAVQNISVQLYLCGFVCDTSTYILEIDGLNSSFAVDDNGFLNASVFNKKGSAVKYNNVTGFITGTYTQIDSQNKVANITGLNVNTINLTKFEKLEGNWNNTLIQIIDAQQTDSTSILLQTSFIYNVTVQIENLTVSGNGAFSLFAQEVTQIRISKLNIHGYVQSANGTIQLLYKTDSVPINLNISNSTINTTIQSQTSNFLTNMISILQTEYFNISGQCYSTSNTPFGALAQKVQSANISNSIIHCSVVMETTSTVSAAVLFAEAPSVVFSITQSSVQARGVYSDCICVNCSGNATLPQNICITYQQIVQPKDLENKSCLFGADQNFNSSGIILQFGAFQILNSFSLFCPDVAKFVNINISTPDINCTFLNATAAFTFISDTVEKATFQNVHINSNITFLNASAQNRVSGFVNSNSQNVVFDNCSFNGFIIGGCVVSVFVSAQKADLQFKNCSYNGFFSSSQYIGGFVAESSANLILFENMIANGSFQGNENVSGTYIANKDPSTVINVVNVTSSVAGMYKYCLYDGANQSNCFTYTRKYIITDANKFQTTTAVSSCYQSSSLLQFSREKFDFNNSVLEVDASGVNSWNPSVYYAIFDGSQKLFKNITVIFNISGNVNVSGLISAVIQNIHIEQTTVYITGTIQKNYFGGFSYAVCSGSSYTIEKSFLNATISGGSQLGGAFYELQDNTLIINNSTVFVNFDKSVQAGALIYHKNLNGKCQFQDSLVQGQCQCLNSSGILIYSPTQETSVAGAKNEVTC